MDNICHTLTGAAFGEAGLKRRTRYGNATLMIAANLPDIDVFVFLTDTPGFEFRRGWTHGILAQTMLPLALAGIVWTLGRSIGRNRGSESKPLSFTWLLLLSYVGVLSHVFLDYLNNYGIRLLAPFDWRWFYGDAVFIVDLFLWMALGVGIWLARRRGRVVFARGALVFAGCYVATMLASANMAREITADAWRGVRGTEPVRVMVGPAPLTPFTRVVIVDAADRYEVGTFRWWPIGVTFEPMSIPKNDLRPEVARASEQSRLVRGFLVWSRFPAWTIEPTPRGSEVSVIDLRFASRAVNGARFQASTIVERGALPGSSHRADPR
jgi:inner membrane protein